MNQDNFYNDNSHEELYLHSSNNTLTMLSTGADINSRNPHGINANAPGAKAALQYQTSNNDSINPNTNPPSQQQQQQLENPITNFFSKSGHPITCIFHILFKVAAILIYIMGGVFEKSTNFVTVTVLCVIFLSMDFWTVKNVTGRLLVGLRWWAHEEVCTYILLVASFYTRLCRWLIHICILFCIHGIIYIQGRTPAITTTVTTVSHPIIEYYYKMDIRIQTKLYTQCI
jgi:hypothetical protein